MNYNANAVVQSPKAHVNGKKGIFGFIKKINGNTKTNESLGSKLGQELTFGDLV